MRRVIAIGALCALQAIGAVAQETPTCIAQCSSQVRADFTRFGCTSADEVGCLCPNADFSFGIQDCSSSNCGATDTDVFNYLSAEFCVAVPPPAPSAEESPAPSESELPTPTETPPPLSTSPIEEPVTSSTSEAAVESTEAPAVPTTSPTTLETSITAPSTTSEPTEVPTEAAGGSADGDEDETEGDAEEEEEEKDSDSGLSEAASIGSGGGVGAAAIAVAAVGLCLFMRHRKRQNPSGTSPIEISRPMPQAGVRTYPTRGHDSYEKYGGDIEMTTNRYDDMPPRQEPRTMV